MQFQKVVLISKCPHQGHSCQPSCFLQDSPAFLYPAVLQILLNVLQDLCVLYFDRKMITLRCTANDILRYVLKRPGGGGGGFLQKLSCKERLASMLRDSTHHWQLIRIARGWKNVFKFQAIYVNTTHPHSLCIPYIIFPVDMSPELCIKSRTIANSNMTVLPLPVGAEVTRELSVYITYKYNVSV